MSGTRYDIARLRKELGLSQKELAEKLGIRQSFLSSIETGKSPLPANKRPLLMSLCHPHHLDDYIIGAPTPHTGAHGQAHPSFIDGNETNMFKELLNYFHEQAHHEKDEHHEQLHMQLNSYQERNDRLTEKNEALQEKIEILNDRIEQLRQELLEVKSENLNLKEQLLNLKN